MRDICRPLELQIQLRRRLSLKILAKTCKSAGLELVSWRAGRPKQRPRRGPRGPPRGPWRLSRFGDRRACNGWGATCAAQSSAMDQLSWPSRPLRSLDTHDLSRMRRFSRITSKTNEYAMYEIKDEHKTCHIRRPRGERGLAPEQVVPVSCGGFPNLSPACPASDCFCGLGALPKPSPT